MYVDTAGLSKAGVFAALYNHAGGRIEISTKQAESILEKYKSHICGPGPLYFDYFDATGFLDGKERDFHGAFLKTDFTSTVIDTSRYDEKYGEGKAEELIHNLRVERVLALKTILREALPTGEERFFGTSRELTKLDNLDELCEQRSALAVKIQNYCRIHKLDLEKTLNPKAAGQTEEAKEGAGAPPTPKSGSSPTIWNTPGCAVGPSPERTGPQPAPTDSPNSCGVM